MDAHVTFDRYRFEPASARLWEEDAEVKLTRKAALVLAALLERPGTPVSKQELFDSVWRGTVVSDDALVTCIQELRRALHDDSRQPRYIETRHRLGYRFAAPVTALAPAPVDAPRIDESAIAVLPFSDMSESRDQDYLCEGLAEELIDALTHIDGLRVAARTSSFQFRDNHNIRDVGGRLGVGTLLEGSVRKAGDRLRITVQLIDVATGYHKWSEKFDLSAADVFAVQDEIAEKVATMLRGGTLNPRERRGLRRQTTAIETYECFLRGRQRMHDMHQPHMDEAREFYERAIALDAEYAPAWAGLAMLHCLLYEWWGAKDSDLAAADRASGIAMSLAPELADAHLARAYTLANMRRYEDARPHFANALLINPNFYDAWYYYGRAAFAAGEIEKSVDLFRRAGEVRREDFEGPTLAAQSLRQLGRREEAAELNFEAVRRLEKYIEINPTNGRALAFGAGALLEAGQAERALEWGRRAVALYPDDMGPTVNLACHLLRVGRKDEALDLLETIFGKGWGKKDWIDNDKDYDSVRDHPRFIAMMAKLK
jgi:adenylate cyclase